MSYEGRAFSALDDAALGRLVIEPSTSHLERNSPFGDEAIQVTRRA